MQHSEAPPVPARQNSRFWMSATSRMVIGHGAPNGVSARGYQEPFASFDCMAVLVTAPAASRPGCIFIHRRAWGERPQLPRTGLSAAGTARTLAAPRGQSGTVNSASRGRGLTGKPVTESNLSLRAPAQIPAQCTVLQSDSLGSLIAHSGVFWRQGTAWGCHGGLGRGACGKAPDTSHRAPVASPGRLAVWASRSAAATPGASSSHGDSADATHGRRPARRASPPSRCRAWPPFHRVPRSGHPQRTR